MNDFQPYIHINRPSGHYLGQVRAWGDKLWTTATGRCKSGESALALAVRRMRPSHFRARVLFVDDGGWYEPNQVMEAKR